MSLIAVRSLLSLSPLSLAGIGLAALCASRPVAARERLDHLRRHGRLVPAATSEPVSLAGRRLGTAAICVAAAALVFTTSVGQGPAVGAAVFIALAVTARVAGQALSRRRRQDLDRQALAVVRLVNAELAAGSRPAAALFAAAAAGTRFERVLRRAAAASEDGDDVAEVLCPVPELSTVGHAWRVASVTGAPMGSVLEQVCGDLAARTNLHQQISALLAGPRASSIMLSGLPLIGLGLGSAMGVHPLEILFMATAGHALVLVGVIFDALGVLWVERILNRAGPA